MGEISDKLQGIAIKIVTFKCREKKDVLEIEV